MRGICKKIGALFFAAICMFSVGTFVGCADTESPYIEIWAGPYWGGDNSELLQSMIDTWNEHAQANGKKQARLLVQQDMAATIQTAGISGRMPELILWDRWETLRYAKQGIFVPLDERLSASGHTRNEFNASALSEFVYGDNLYGIPLDLDTWGYFVNRKFYLEWAESDSARASDGWLINKYDGSTETVGEADSKYNYPSTWEQFYEAVSGCTVGDRLTGNFTRAGINTDQNFTAFLATVGGRLVNEDKTRIIVGDHTAVAETGISDNRAAVEKVLAFWDKMLWHKNDSDEEKQQACTSFSFVSNNTGAVDLFLSEKVAFMSNSLLNGMRMYNKYKTDDFEFDFIPFPSGENEGKTFESGMLGGYGFVIPSSSKKIDEAWEMLSWWVLDDDNYYDWTRICHLLPGRASVLERLQNDTELLQNASYLKRAMNAVDGYVVRPPSVAYTVYETQVLTPTLDTYFKRTGSFPTGHKNGFFDTITGSADLTVYS